jgi:SNF2 family DNA or RNA helicase
VLKEVINESAKKVLVFVPFKHTIQIVAEKLQDDGISTNVISGNVTASKRSEIFKKFQTEPDPRVLVIQPQSAAHGVTLTAANTVVWWAPIMSLETYAQANARVHRAGQDNKCTVVQLQGSPVERHFWVAIDNKTNIHTEIVELYRKLL